MRKLCRLGVKIGEVRDARRIQGFGKAEFMQNFRKGRRHEHDIIARAARGDQLAHDFLVGGVQDQFGVDPCFGGEGADGIGRHVAIPVRDGQFLGQNGGARQHLDGKDPGRHE